MIIIMDLVNPKLSGIILGIVVGIIGMIVIGVLGDGVILIILHLHIIIPDGEVENGVGEVIEVVEEEVLEVV
jgi:hypothetical protein